MWAQPILNVVFDGVSATVDYQLQQPLPVGEDGSKRYYRFEIALEIGNDNMDDASQTNLFALKSLAQRVISQHDDDLAQQCEQLMTADAP